MSLLKIIVIIIRTLISCIQTSIPAPTEGHSSKTEEVINDGRGQTLASELRRNDGLVENASGSTTLQEQSQATATIRAEHTSTPAPGTTSPTSNNKEEQIPQSANAEQQAFVSTEFSVQNPGSTQEYYNGVYMNNELRTRMFAHEPTEIPSLGKVNPHSKNIYMYGRCVIAVPGELTTKTVTNPHIVQVFKYSVPDVYESQGQRWYSSPQYISSLVNMGQSVLESCFPFNTFQTLGLGYQLQPQSIFFNYLNPEGNEYLFHRINLEHIKTLDPQTRAEHLQQSVPLPVEYRTPSGTVFHGCFDIAYTVAAIIPKHTRNLPGNRNESIFMDGINHLATLRSETLVILSRLLQLYNDYRVNAYRKPQPFFNTDGEPYILQQPPQVDPVTNAPLNQPAMGQPDQAPVMHSIPVPQYTHQQIHAQQLAMMQQQQQQEMYFQQLQQTYSPPYEECQPPARQKKSKRKNIQLDPTIPWQPGHARL